MSSTNHFTYIGGGSLTWRSFYRPLIIRTLKNFRTCLQWAWLDTKCHYRRSRIGPFWETINLVVTIVGLAVIHTALFGGTIIGAIGYIGLGMMTWAAILTLFNEGATSFIRNAPLIHGSSISIDMYVGRTVFRTMITFGHHIVLYFAGLALGLVPLSWTSVLAVPGVILLFVNGYWIGAALGLLCARFRDVELIVRNLLQLAFFATPVFWNADIVQGRYRAVIDYNPFFYFIELIRAPLLGQVPPLTHYAVVVACAVVGYALALITYRALRRQLAFFV